MKLSVNEAMDLIDECGPDETFWPPEHVAAMNRYVAGDPEFRSYVEDAKWLESMLENWDYQDDGAEIDFDTDLDNDEDGPRRRPSDTDEEDAEDEQDEDLEDFPFGSIPVDAGSRRPDVSNTNHGGDFESEREEEDDKIIEVDASQIKDMDALMQEFIRKQIEDAAGEEFRVFTRDFDAMVDIAIPDQVSLEGIDQKVASATGPLQKDLRRLIAARSQVKRVPGMRSGRLHGPNLHRIMANDDRVFTRRQEAESLDTALSLLIDCSGSMNGARTVLATEASYALGSVLAKLGIAFECLGFTDKTEDPRVREHGYLQEVRAADEVAKIHRMFPIVMPKFKAFEERWTIPVMRRFGHVHNSRGQTGACGYNMGYTPEGCGLEFAARRLLQRKERRKILICMTDGEPGSLVFEARSAEDYGAYARQSRQVVKAIEASGIDLVGVGIQHAGPTAYYSNAIVINDVNEMPRQLLALLKRFIVG
ncbi:Cobalamin biosynthesis protein CobT VWA domain-containing protein [Sphingomonas sp. NFR04]|uniref:cobaltochelatase CobT-related protein n=1 Tax=Sphingomonas sp. NFR04 TaxID=1566283 RepID=UPI0008E973E9|nr:hypothetical protein [Sphingomonas sp. NFR04]SFJ49996.1 Cobalamin biosynthesis protein CobT VWA domain-containing protein [Sphingomonas sp. NFR04]